MHPFAQRETTGTSSPRPDVLHFDDMRKLRKRREDRIPSLTALLDILEDKGFIDYEKFRNGPLVELQAGNAPITPIVRQKCAVKGFTPETWAVDVDPQACAEIETHQDIPHERIVNRDTIEGLSQIIDSGIQPQLITLTNYYPQHNSSLADLALAISVRMPGRSKVLITCADDAKPQFDQLIATLNAKSPLFHHVKVLHQGEVPELITQYPDTVDKYVLVFEVERPIGFLDLTKYVKVRPEDARARQEFDLQLYDPALDALRLFRLRRKPDTLTRPIQEILDDAFKRHRPAYDSDGEFEKAKPRITREIYRNYGLLTDEQLNGLERDLLSGKLGEIANTLSSHIEGLSTASLEQINQIVKKIFPDGNQAKIGNNIRHTLDTYLQIFSLLEQPVKQPFGQAFCPIMANLDAMIDRQNAASQVARQLQDSIPWKLSVTTEEADESEQGHINAADYIKKYFATAHTSEVSNLLYLSVLDTLADTPDPIVVVRNQGVEIVVKAKDTIKSYQIPPTPEEILSDQDIQRLLILGEAIHQTKMLAEIALSAPKNQYGLAQNQEMIRLVTPLIFTELYSKIDPQSLRTKSLRRSIQELYGKSQKSPIRIIEDAAQKQFDVLPKNNIFSYRCLYHQPGGYYVTPSWFMEAALASGLTFNQASSIFEKEKPPAWLFSDTTEWGEE